MDAYIQCITYLSGCKSNENPIGGLYVHSQLLFRGRSTWPGCSPTLPRSLAYTPFIPFGVLFSHVAQTSSPDDMSRLDAFAVSVSSLSQEPGWGKESHQIYQLLCQAARTTAGTRGPLHSDHVLLEESTVQDPLFSFLENEEGMGSSLVDDGLALGDFLDTGSGWWTAEEMTAFDTSEA